MKSFGLLLFWEIILKRERGFLERQSTGDVGDSDPRFMAAKSKKRSWEGGVVSATEKNEIRGV